MDFWSACSPWSIVKAQLTAASDTQRQFLGRLMQPTNLQTPSAVICVEASPVKRRQQYLTAAVSILAALGMDTKALEKCSETESDVSVTARRIAILQAVLESIEAGSPPPCSSSSSFHAVEPGTSDHVSSSAQQSAQADCEDEGHDLSPVLFSVNGSQRAQSRNANAASHVDSYVSFLDALDEEADLIDEPQGSQPVYGSLASSHLKPAASHSGRAVVSRTGDVSTPSPPAADDDSPSSSSCLQASELLGSSSLKKGPGPLTLFTSLSQSSDNGCSTADMQLSPRALRVSQV